MTNEQEQVLRAICARYHVPFREDDYTPQFDLPTGYVAGWVGGRAVQTDHPTIYVGVSPEGKISS